MNELPDLHPSPESLRKFLLGQLQNTESEQVELHIVGCGVCCNHLEELSSDDDPVIASLNTDVLLPALAPAVSGASAPKSMEAMPGTAKYQEQHGVQDILDTNETSIGPYRLLGLIGEGGMGRVYKARHEKLNRLVALKMVHDHRLHEPQLSVRFAFEAESIARLKHPNIVQIYDVGYHNEQPYYAMEFVKGASLDQAIKAETFNARDAAELVKKLADAIHDAHERGIVHRDLKPANVLLEVPNTNRGATIGEPKIADFGIAKQLGTDSDLTQTGLVAGTPNYMAPEQVRGQQDLICPGTDVYALGVILFELLTGKTPFAGATPLEVMNQILDSDPVTSTLVAKHIPADLVSVCLQCIRKEPARRYANANSLSEDLERFLTGRSVAARRSGLVERSWRWSRRRPSLSALIAIVTLLALVGFPGAILLWLDASRAKDLAEQSVAVQRWATYRSSLVAAGSALQQNNTNAARRALDTAPEEHRNWEWAHYNHRLRGAKLVLRGHEGPVRNVAVSPDGRLLASASADGTVRIWNTQLGKLVATLPSQSEARRSPQLAFSPDGRYLLAPGPDNSITVWDAQSYELHASLPGHSPSTLLCQFSDDGTRIVTLGWEGKDCHIWSTETAKLIQKIDLESTVCGAAFNPVSNDIAISQANGTVGIWDGANGKLIARWNAHKGFIKAPICFSTDGKLLATGGNYGDNIIKIWQALDGDLVQELKGHANAIFSIAFSPDGALLASGTADNAIGLWDVASGELLSINTSHAGSIFQVSFSPDGTLLASASRDQTIRLWDPVDGRQIALMHGHSDAIEAFVFDPHGKTIYSASDDHTIAAWDVVSRKKTGVLRGHDETLGDVTFSPDGTRCALASWDGTVRIWDVAEELELLQLSSGSPIVTGVVFHPSGDQLVAVDRKTLTVWDSHTGKQLHQEELPMAYWPYRRVAISPDGRFLTTGTFEGDLIWWNAETWQRLSKTPAHNDPCRDVAFSPDSRFLVTAGNNDGAQIWNIPSRERVETLRGHERAVTCASFNHSGTLIATGSEDGTVHIWDAKEYTQLAVLNHGSYVYDLAFNPDGKRLVVGCDDHSIRLWDTATWTDVGQLLGHGTYVWALTFSPDGKQLLSGSGDSMIRIWDTSTH